MARGSATTVREDYASLRQRRAPDVVAWAYAGLALILIGVWLSGAQAWWAHHDAVDFHLPEIRKILTQGVGPGFSAPVVAMPAGFHTVAALLAMIAGGNIALAGRLLSLACMLLALWATWSFCARLGREGKLVNLVLILGSWSLLSATFSVVTDTMGFALFVLCCLCLEADRYLLAAVTLAALVLVRQYYAAPAVALLITAAWVMASGQRRRAAALALAAVPALLVLASLYRLWGSLIPPQFQSMHRFNGLNGGAVTLILTWAGVVGIAARVCGVKWSDLSSRALGLAGGTFRSGLGSRSLLYIVTPCALVLMVLLPTDSNMAAGRWGGIIWRIANLTNTGGRSYPLVALGVVGCWFILRTLFDVLRSGNELALVLLLSGAGLSAEVILQPFAWQRYVDPMVGFCLVNAYLFARLQRTRVSVVDIGKADTRASEASRA